MPFYRDYVCPQKAGESRAYPMDTGERIERTAEVIEAFLAHADKDWKPVDLSAYLIRINPECSRSV